MQILKGGNEVENHKAIVMGRIEKKRFLFCTYHSYQPKIQTNNEFVGYKEIWSGDLENPPLETGDSLYIKELDIKVGITDKAKSTDGGYVYWTYHLIEEIEDEKTQETKLKAEQDELDYKKRIEEQEKIQLIEEKPTKKWWNFWK